MPEEQILDKPAPVALVLHREHLLDDSLIQLDGLDAFDKFLIFV
jgi:hypothetical protein